MGVRLRILLAAAFASALLAVPTAAAVAAPAAVSPPTVVDDGTPADGETLSATPGSWSPPPSSVAYQWLRCDVSGATCGNVGGATAQTYRLAPADVGSTIRVSVTADGAVASSAPTAVVQAVPPASSIQPVVSGPAQEGATLSATSGSWSGTTPLSFAYQWQHCGTYRANVLADTPAGYWRLGDAAGAAAADASGAGHPGTYGAGATPGVAGALAGDPDTAASFASGLVDVPGIANATLSAGFTIEAWVKTSAAQTDRGLAGKWRYADGGGAMLWLSTSGTYSLVVTRTSANYLVSTVAPTPGRWEHVVGTWDGARLRLYRNGVELASKAFAGSIGTPVPSFQIGGYGGAQYFSGALDDVAVYGRALSAADVKRHYDAGANPCVDVAGATAPSYAVSAADNGFPLRVAVTASNASLPGGGSATAFSAQTAPVTKSPPVNTGAPVLTGSAQQDATLSVSQGTWSGNPTAFAYRWRRCDTSGSACTDIVGATGTSYTLVTADVGSTVRADVTATNAFGSATATSNATAPVASLVPVATSPPTIAGVPRIGALLTAGRGTWSSVDPPSFALQWRRCDAAGTSCANIAGATGDAYTLTQADVGSTVRIAVTASTAAGSTTASSAQTGVVAADTVAPTATITSPADGGVASRTVTVAVTASDDLAVASVRLELDGQALGTPLTAAPYSFSWDTPTAADGPHTLRALARDPSGNEGAASVSVTVDNTAPTVALADPGAVLRGTVHLAGTASDGGSGLASLTFQRAAAGSGSWTDTAADWNTAAGADGSYDLRAVATDRAGNTAVSAPVTARLVDNTPPTLSFADPGTYLRGTVALSATAADAGGSGLAGVAYERSPAGAGAWSPVPASWNTTTAADGPYDLRAVATDVAGNATTVRLDGRVVDNTAPSASVTDPGAGAIVSGVTTIAAAAADAAGVDRVAFERSPTGTGAWTTIATALGAPWQVQWDTSGLPNGGYDLRAVVTDHAGNTTASAPVAVTLDRAAETGRWEGPYAWPLVPVHMALQPDGQVIAWDGFEFAVGSEHLWNPATGVFTAVAHDRNLFCAGQTLLADGRTFMAGGHVNPYEGLPDATIFDSATHTWTRAPDMAHARWYPTTTSLPDGRVLVVSGDNISQGNLNQPPPLRDQSSTLPEVYDPVANSWTQLPGASWITPLYPFMFVLPDGRIFDAGPDQQTRILDLATSKWTDVGRSPIDGYSAVMYRPGKILKSGTWAAPGYPGLPMTGRAAVIDMTASAPAWREVGSMANQRAYHTLTVLPDGNVLATGGESASDGTDLTKAVLPAELWNAQTEQWTTMASMQTPRLYHSTALLLPDGRVLVAGGGRWQSATSELNAEIYSPPYLFKGTRPKISSAPSVVPFGGGFTVSTPDAARIAKVALIRLGADTHGFDMSQRYVPLDFTRGDGSLTVTGPANANVAPPGYYMLFVVDGNGVPSVAAITRVPLPDRDVTAPSVSVTAPAAGATLTAATTLTADAGDNVGVAGVQFKVDGVNVGAEDVLAPYTMPWDAGSATHGAHTITAVARDTAGNTTTSAPVTVRVDRGLVAAYSFDEGAGPTVRDSSGRGNDGTISGAAWALIGKYGSALSFDGVNDWITVPDSDSLDPTSGLTLEAWVRPNALGPGWRTILMKENGSKLAYALYGSSNVARPTANVFTTGYFSVNGSAELPANAWTHLAATFDGTTLRLFVNGTQAVNTRSVTGVVPASPGPLRIGGNGIVGEWFNGLIDEVRVYNRKLSGPEIVADMNTGLGPFAP